MSSVKVAPVQFVFFKEPIQKAKKSLNHLIGKVQSSFICAPYIHLKNRYFPCLELTQLQKIKNLREQVNQEKIVLAVLSSNFYHLRPQIYQLLKNSSDEELTEVILQLFRNKGAKNIQLVIKRLNSLLTLAKVEALWQHKVTLKQQISEMAGAIERERKNQQLTAQGSFLRLVKFYITTTLDWLVETSLYVLMLKDITDGDATNTERQMIAALQWQAFRENLTLLSAWLIALAVYTGSAATAAMLSAAIAAPIVTIAYIYLKYFKPPPAHLHPATNLTELAVKDKLPTVLFRDDTVDQVISLLNVNASTKNMRTYPLLIGQSGVGKSDLFKRLAQKISQGTVAGPLKGTTVYGVNTAMLIDGQGDPAHAELMEKRLHGYEEEAIICLDEIQAAFDTDAGRVLGKILLTTMDSNGWPFMIFACTKEDYETHLVSNHAFMRRVQVFEVDSLTNKQTYAVLIEEMMENFPDILIAPNVLQRIAAVNQQKPFINAPQPVTSKRILLKAISKLKMAELSEVKNSLIEAKALLKEHDLKKKVGDGVEDLLDAEEKMIAPLTGQGISQKIAELEHTLQEQSRKLGKFKGLLAARKKLDQTSHQLAVRIASKKSAAAERKEFILIEHFLKPSLQEKIERKKDALGPNCPEITMELIEQIMEEEREQFIKKEDVK